MPNNYPPNERDRGSAYPQDDRYPPSDDRYGDPRGPDPRPPSDDAESAGPEGEFPIVAVKHAFGKAGTSTYQIGVRVCITDGVHKGRTALWYGAFTPDAESITLRGMKALGHEGDDILDCRGFYERDGSPKKSSAAIGVFTNETYKGKTRWRCSFINGGDIVMKEELSQSEAAAFQHRMRATLARHGGTPAQSSRRDAGPPPPRDDRQSQRGYHDDRPPPRDDRAPNGRDNRDPWR